jgi:hypothetical protein
VRLKQELCARTRPGRDATRTLTASFLALAAALVLGCGGSSIPMVGPIQFTAISGAPLPAVSSLAVNGVIYLVATVTNDDEQLGVSWTVACGSLPAGGGEDGGISTACGVCDPTQTASGPVPTYPSTGIITSYIAPPTVPKGNTVTITAHATSLPSVTSNLTLTIVPAGQTSSAIVKSPANGVSDAAKQAGS